MIKVVALYAKPDDEAAFLDHYNNVHLPLVRKTPGLAKLEVSRVTGAASGEPPYFLMAEMSFPDRDTFRAAMRSPENQAVVADLNGFAKGLATVLICQVEDGG